VIAGVIDLVLPIYAKDVMNAAITISLQFSNVIVIVLGLVTCALSLIRRRVSQPVFPF
jgi:hypothetical protein